MAQSLIYIFLAWVYFWGAIITIMTLDQHRKRLGDKRPLILTTVFVFLTWWATLPASIIISIARGKQ